jgi:pimeloyl-ACP methyl ester carboxylesterase
VGTTFKASALKLLPTYLEEPAMADSFKLILPGQKEAENATEANPFLTINVRAEHRVDATTRGAAEPPEAERETLAEADDIVEMEFENGVRRWVPVSQLPQEVRPLAQQRGGAPLIEDGTIRIPATLGSPGDARGPLKEFALKAIKVLGVPSPAEILSDLKGLVSEQVLTNLTAKVAARLIALKFEGGVSLFGKEIIEGKLKPGAGLYRFTNPQALSEPDRLTQTSDLPVGGDPFLLFVHGTFSSAPGAFFALNGTEEWRAMQGRYGNRVIAFNHPTLSVSPLVNALELAKLLPERARLHLVSHSRGGLVGELLALQPVKGQDLVELVQPFAEATDFPDERKQDEQRLRELIDVLAQKQFQIERFVRVACPARGTLLVGDRLDTYVSAILNGIGMAAKLTGNPVVITGYEFAKALVLALLKCKADPNDLPGLEAQRPSAPFIHLLNRPDQRTAADLSVIGGDIEGAGIKGNIIAGVSNTFYLRQNDLVVNTDSMDGGLSRSGPTRLLVDQGANVAHSNYFINQKTRQALWYWLDKPAETAAAAPARGVRLDLTAPAAATRGGAEPDKPVVFLLPGIMGSHLKDKNGRVWLDPVALALGGMRRLELDDFAIEADGVVGESYQDLVDFLQTHYNVRIFAYDWRRSITEAAARLAARLIEELKNHNRPVRLLAHSMGGLVARALVAYHGDVWQQVCARGGRLLMLGTPNNGAHAIARLLLGQERLLRMLALLDFRHDVQQLTAIISQYPGILQMLPDEYLDTAELQKLKPLSLPAAAVLAEAKAVRETLRQKAVDAKFMLYVAGSAAQTPSSIEMVNGKPVIKATPLGDGRVTYELGQLNGVRTWYMDAEHGDLADHEPAFPALVELLEKGETNKLADQPKAKRGLVEETILRDDEAELVLFPKPEEIVREALGSRPKRKAVHGLRVSVAHGDLRFARYPVAVGHYTGDVIVSAEKTLDDRLNQRLTQRFNIGMYPGPVGTAEVVYVPEATPPGALIIGLGEVGEITPEKVRNGVLRAALRYALTIMDEPMRNGESTQHWRSAAFSALLLGTYGGQALGVEASVSAIVQGALQANRELRALGLWDRVRVDEVELIELYADVALQAMRAAWNLADNPPLDLFGQEKIEIANSYLLSKAGGRFLRPANQHASGWPRRIQITGEERENGDALLDDLRFLALTDRANEKDTLDAIRRRLKGETTSAPKIKDLAFLALTDRARAEDTVQATQRQLVDQLVRAAIDSPSYDARLGLTLFELLVPNGLKSQTDAQASLVLVLDSEAAQYPWELLAERTREEPRPIALEKGLIRQFKTANFRPNPQAARDQYVLVIGDPKNDFSQLPGAKREAETVAAKFREHLDTNKVIARIGAENTATDVINELFAREYNIIHLAGHGDYQPDEPAQSGMVLSDGLRLSTAELRQMRTVPDLVFINCCHLGRIDELAQTRLRVREPQRLAASVAEELINMGVKAVVAAGWAVDDAAAETFALTFYEQMFSGATFGDAVLLARKAAHVKHGDVNTWGAYQCYGNPGFTLPRAKSSVAVRAGGKHRYFSAEEYRDRLQQLAFRAKFELERRAEWLLEVTELRRGLPPHLLDGGLLGVFAQTCRDLGDLKTAIGFYRDALQAEAATASLQDVEQLANLESRYATQLLSQGKRSAEARRMLETSNQRVEGLLKIGQTAERLALKAGNHKRLARLTKSSARAKHLQQAADDYRAAYELGLQRTNEAEAYPALNWIACAYLIAEPAPARRSKGRKSAPAGPVADWLDVIALAEAAAEQEERTESSFWNRVAAADGALLRHLVSGDLPTKQDEVHDAYRAVFNTGASAAEIATVLDQLDFLAEMLESAKPAAQRAAQRALVEIREQLAE